MDFLVLSHLRWDFVYQRPQHLLSRCGRQARVFFWEEPVFRPGIEPHLGITPREDQVKVVVPQLPEGLSEPEAYAAQEKLLREFIAEHQLRDIVLWYYTPLALNFTRQLSPAVTVYDCMDELSAFRGAPPGLRNAEAELLVAADLVFTGGQSLFESKRDRHPSVHCFPSSIDSEHFGKARELRAQGPEEPPDQRDIPHPRLGYCGVIDERMDLDLIAGIAKARPDWHIVMLGPVVKISQDELPNAANIHWVGGKKYQELPLYMAGWDVALLPFARNESTRYISPTKTPEYLAAGLPVVSTPITDVVRPYGEMNLVAIEETAEGFVKAAEQQLQSHSPEEEQERLRKVDLFLKRSSWKLTWEAMHDLIRNVAESRRGKTMHDQPTVGVLADAD